MGRKKKGNPVHGWLVLDKPTGVTSTQMVGRARRLLNAQKAGHGGTLDPLATGILPLAFGEATKTVSYAMDGRKTYAFSVRWGQETDSCDSDGQITQESDHRPDEEAIRAVLPEFLGPIQQIPPRFSALKVDGKRAYDLARSNQEFELEARRVEIFRLELLSVDGPDQATFEVDCGKGTYVRSLARDIAGKLGTLGHIVMLRRLRVGPFGLEHAISLESLDAMGHSPAAGEELHQQLLPIRAALDDISVLALSETEAADLRFGRKVVLDHTRARELAEDLSGRSDQTILAEEGVTPVALCQLDDLILSPVRVLNL